MSYERLAYDDASTSTEMTADCRAVEAALVRAAVRPAPSIRYEDYPREVGKPTITVSEAAARLGAAVQLHLD
jgi:hypothetical protein